MKHENELLVEFEFLVNMDIALYHYVKNNFSDSPYVNKSLLNIPPEAEPAVNQILINRKTINPLRVIIPGMKTDSLYEDLMSNHEGELLEYAKVYDTFPLMITYLNLASVGVKVFCKNNLEIEYINKLNKRLETILVPDVSKIVLDPYTCLYVKYFMKLIDFPVINGKNIYIPAAGFNMEKNENCVDKRLAWMFSQSNEVRLIDLFKYVKFRFNKSREDITES
jgi:hypothetical protein